MNPAVNQQPEKGSRKREKGVKKEAFIVADAGADEWSVSISSNKKRIAAALHQP
jgi:hypothetical protein